MQDQSFGGTEFSDSFFMDASPESRKKKGGDGMNLDGGASPLGLQYGSSSGVGDNSTGVIGVTLDLKTETIESVSHGV